MSNIDFSRLVTAQDTAAQIAAAHATSVKAECKRRILAQFPFEAQHNIAQAVNIYTAALVQGGTQVEAEALSGLCQEDMALFAAGRRWIAAMQATCRARIAEMQDSAAWPTFPEGLAELVSRS
ncbi:hypothetical protein [Phaeobacter sp. J2-8]|uniref:hypothetical protein n=1 Tax=Phaeobacter sp. J2-8 TaxID=2931394 RepID=UPI001FD318E1|nr:hypothetical protein [Phaeobacter sp. J2-8]MCJ7874812.1 hypothetical protein [Phaeobacter sp. J2-8]